VNLGSLQVILSKFNGRLKFQHLQHHVHRHGLRLHCDTVQQEPPTLNNSPLAHKEQSFLLQIKYFSCIVQQRYTTKNSTNVDWTYICISS